MAGVIATGFDRKELATIEQEIKDEILATISADLNLSSSSVWGQFISIVSSKASELWEIEEELYRIIDPDNATGTALDILCALTGTTRLPATKSTVNLTVNIDAGVTLAVGRIVSLSTDPDRKFVTTAAVTNGTAEPGNFQVAAEAQDTGPVAALAGNIDTIDTPQAGWNSVTNGDVQASVLSDSSEPFNLTDSWTLTADIDGVADTATFNVGTAASVTSGNSETFALSDGMTLLVKVDGGGTQTVVFNTADFITIGAATAAEVAAVITTDLTGASATNVGPPPETVKITTASVGPAASVQVVGGTSNTALGFSTTEQTGGGDFANIAAATADEVVDVLNADLGAATATNEGGQIRITSNNATPSSSSVEVTGGLANGAFNFGTVEILGYDGNDAALGRDLESDEALRLRREDALSVSGKGTVDAIRADILGVTGVTACDVYENTSLVTDGDGVPGKAFEAVVVGGDADDIAQAIWDSKPAGIEAHGDVTGNAVDAAGNAKTVDFSRPDPLYVTIEYTLTTNGDFPADGHAQVKAAFLAYGATLSTGDDIIYEAVKARAFGVSGVVDVTLFEINAEPDPPGPSAPTGADIVNIVVGSRELTDWDTSRMSAV